MLVQDWVPDWELVMIVETAALFMPGCSCSFKGVTRGNSKVMDLAVSVETS